MRTESDKSLLILSHSDISFTFKCHRRTVNNTPGANHKKARSDNSNSNSKSNSKVTKVYAVNDIQFHPLHSATFATAGSDGSFVFWDRVARSRLREYLPPTSTSADESPAPAITASSFSRDGRFFAYAVGYDWSRGCAGNTPQTESKVLLHSMLEEDVKS